MLSVDQYLITIMMAILTLLMKLHSKYTEKTKVKLWTISHCPQINLFFRENEKTSVKENWVFPF